MLTMNVMKALSKKMGSRKYWLNIIISIVGIGIVFLYKLCEGSCSYMKGNIFSLDLKYLGILYMGLLILFTLLRKNSIILFLLSSGLGAEIYLIGFQIKHGISCYYCLAFGAVILVLFLLNCDMSKKVLMGASLVLGFVIFLVFFHGIVTPLYAEDLPQGDLLPTFGKGHTHVRLYTDYFCGPCSTLEPKLESLITDLVKKNVISITFIDTPAHTCSPLYAKYFLYILNEKKEFNRALKVRAALFEAARLKITEEENLKEFLNKRKIEFKPFHVTPIFSLMNIYLKEDKIKATPTCVIFNGESKSYTGTSDIINALEGLKVKNLIDNFVQ
jgi:thiol-disulfide isomerase/thioredoxin